MIFSTCPDWESREPVLRLLSNASGTGRRFYPVVEVMTSMPIFVTTLGDESLPGEDGGEILVDQTMLVAHFRHLEPWLRTDGAEKREILDIQILWRDFTGREGGHGYGLSRIAEIREGIDADGNRTDQFECTDGVSYEGDFFKPVDQTLEDVEILYVMGV